MLNLQTNKFKAFALLLCAGLGFASLCCKAYEKPNYSVDYTSNKVQFTKNTDFGGVELSLFTKDTSSYYASSTYYSTSNNTDRQSRLEFRPEISLFTSEKSSNIDLHRLNNAQKGKSNRYKNTIPAIFRLTLKGYSIMEYSNNVTQTWSLDKVKNKAISKPTIMFSYTKQF